MKRIVENCFSLLEIQQSEVYSGAQEHICNYILGGEMYFQCDYVMI